MKTLKYRDPSELFDDCGFCEICEYLIREPQKEGRYYAQGAQGEHEKEVRLYRHAIEYHFELHLKRDEIKMVNRKKEGE